MVSEKTIVLPLIVLAAILVSVYPLISTHSSIVMTTDKSVYSIGDTVTVTLYNGGVKPVYFGTPYTVEKLVNNTWIIDENLTPDFFTCQLIVLYPGGEYSWHIPLKISDAGEYRVVKTVWLDDRGDEKVTVLAYFQVYG